MKKIAVNRYVRFGVSAALLAIIISIVDTENAFEILATIDIRLMLIPTLLLFVQTAISALKWKLILDIEDTAFSLPFLFKTYLISQFISLFLPSSIGGDVYRIAVIKHVQPSFSARFSSVVFDRGTGLYGLFVVAATGAYVLLHSWIIYLIFSALVIIPVAFLGLTSNTVMRWMEGSKSRVVTVVSEILAANKKYALSVRVIPIMLLGILFHFGVVLINYLYCSALGLHVPFAELWAIVPLIAITDMIPISINGIGIRDSAYVFFFSILERPVEHAFALSLLIIAMRYIYGAFGGLFLLGDILRGKSDLSPASLVSQPEKR